MRPHKLSGKLALIAMAVVLFLSTATFAQYTQTNLVSNVPGRAVVTDPNLVNSWGLAAAPTSPWWVADAGTGLSTLYRGDGSIVPLVVAIPQAGQIPVAVPTGIVFNSSTDFTVSSGGASGPSVFLFVTINGTIAGWNPGVSLTNAVTAVDNSGIGSVYTGLAIAKTNGGNFIFAANFHNNSVEEYDANFQLVRVFTDIDLPANYAPFGIRMLGAKLYVAYAKRGADGRDVPGAGHGFVDVFNANSGRKVTRLVSNGKLNSPWGLAIAPANFGKFSNALLVGNFGDGKINAYDQTTGAWLGSLKDGSNKVLVIDKLWGIAFGNGNASGPRNSLYFSSGPDNETNGLFGKIEAIP